MSKKLLTKEGGYVSREDREAVQGHKAAVVWLTGLSGAGKTTIAHALERYLFARGCRVYVLDGDSVRHGLCSDLGFSTVDRSENIRRIGEVAKLFVDAGVIVVAAFISPLRDDREKVRGKFGCDQFVEVYCNASLELCEMRDVKGLYKKARSGALPEFTGITSPYQEPLAPELMLDTGMVSIDEGVDSIANKLYSLGILN